MRSVKPIVFALLLLLPGMGSSAATCGIGAEKGDVLFVQENVTPFWYSNLTHYEREGIFWFCDQFSTPCVSWVIHASPGGISQVAPFEGGPNSFKDSGLTYMGAYSQPLAWKQFRNEVVYQTLTNTLGKPYNYMFWRHIGSLPPDVRSQSYAYVGMVRPATTFKVNAPPPPHQQYDIVAPWGTWFPNIVCDKQGAILDTLLNNYDTATADLKEQAKGAAQDIIDSMPTIPFYDKEELQKIADGQIDSLSQSGRDAIASWWNNFANKHCPNGMFAMNFAAGDSVRSDGLAEIGYELAGRPYNRPWDNNFGKFVDEDLPFWNLPLLLAEQILEGPHAVYLMHWLADFALFHTDEDVRDALNQLNPAKKGVRPDWTETFSFRDRLYSSFAAPIGGSRVSNKITMLDGSVIEVPSLQTGLFPSTPLGPVVLGTSPPGPGCFTIGQRFNVNVVAFDGAFGSGMSRTEDVGLASHQIPDGYYPGPASSPIYPSGSVSYFAGDPDLPGSSFLCTQVNGIDAPNNAAFYDNAAGGSFFAYILNNFSPILTFVQQQAATARTVVQDALDIWGRLTSFDFSKITEGVEFNIETLIRVIRGDESIRVTLANLKIVQEFIKLGNDAAGLGRKIELYRKLDNPQIYSCEIVVPCAGVDGVDIWVKAVDQACNVTKMKVYTLQCCQPGTPTVTPDTDTDSCGATYEVWPEDITGISSAVVCDPDGNTYYAVTNNGSILSFEGSPDFTGVKQLVEVWGTGKPAMAALDSACKCPADNGLGGTTNWAVGNSYSVIYNDGTATPDPRSAWISLPIGLPNGLPPVSVGVVGNQFGLRAVDAVPGCGGEVWVAGEYGVILHKAATGSAPDQDWSLANPPVTSNPTVVDHISGIREVAVPDATACNQNGVVIAVGYRLSSEPYAVGTLRWSNDDATFNEIVLPAGTRKLNALVDLGNGELYAVGDAGTLLHITLNYGPTACGTGVSGLTVELVDIGTVRDLLSVTAVSPTNIVVGARDGRIVIWNGIQWTQYDTGESNDFKALYSKSGFNYAICSCGIQVALPCPRPEPCETPGPGCLTCETNCSVTRTPSLTSTISATPTHTPTATPSVTPSATPSPQTRTATLTSSITVSPTDTPTATPTATPTHSPTPRTVTESVTRTYSASPTDTPTITLTATPTITNSITLSHTISATRTPFTPTATSSYTVTPTPHAGTGDGSSRTTTPIVGFITQTLTPTPSCPLHYNAICCTCCDDDEVSAVNWLVGDCMVVHRQGGITPPPVSPAGVQGSDPSISLRAVACFSPDEIWTVGDQGTVLHTIDGGQTWDLVLGGGASATPSVSSAPWGTGTVPNLVSVDTSSDGDTVTIADNTGGIYLSYDRGLSWSAIVPNCPAGLSCATQLTKIKLANPTNNETWVLGDNGAIYWGTGNPSPVLTMIDPLSFPNGGVNFDDLPPNTTSSEPVGSDAYFRERWQQVTFNDIYVVHNNHFVATGDDCTMSATANENCGEVWAVGDHGVILRGLEGPGGVWNWTREGKTALVPQPLYPYRMRTTERLVAIDWADPDKITVAGDGVLLRWTGADWIRTNIFHFEPVAICRDYICINDPPGLVSADDLADTPQDPVTWTFTVSPTPSPSPTGTPSCNIRVQYLAERVDNSVGEVAFRMALVNDGSGPLELGQVKVRYWLTADGGGAFATPVWWAGISPQNSTLPVGSVLAEVLPVSQGGQTQALEVSFAAGLGSLPAGQQIEWTMGLSQASGNQVQTDDYSFSPANGGLVDWPKATGYCGGQLAWGVEPADPTATPSLTSTWTSTSSPSPTPSATPTITPSATPSDSPSASPSHTGTWTPSQTPSVTLSFSSTFTPSVTPSATPSASPSATPTETPSQTATYSFTRTLTASPSQTGSATLTSSLTASPSGTVTPSASPSVSLTRTATPGAHHWCFDREFQAPNNGSAYGVATDPLSGVYASVLGARVHHFANGSTVGSTVISGVCGSIPTSTLCGARDVALGGDGLLYVVDQGASMVRQIAIDGSSGVNIGGYGATDADLDSPYYLAVHDGEVYVTDETFSGSGARVKVFGVDGSPHRAWGSFGGGVAQIQFPRGIAVGDSPAGVRVYVADNGGQRIQVYDSLGNHQGQLFGPGAWPGSSATVSPQGLALDAYGNLYIGAGTTVLVTDAGGALLGELGGGGAGVGGVNYAIKDVDVAPDGGVYVSSGTENANFNNTKFLHYAYCGSFTATPSPSASPMASASPTITPSSTATPACCLADNGSFGTGSYPGGIFVGAGDKIYVATQPYVQRFATNGSPEMTYGFGILTDARAAVVIGGEVLVLDVRATAPRMERFDEATGAPLGGWDIGAGEYPANMQVGSDGNIYISLSGRPAVLRFSPSGTPLGEFAVPFAPNSFGGGLTRSGNRLVLAANNSAYVFENDGTPVETVPLTDGLPGAFHTLGWALKLPDGRWLSSGYAYYGVYLHDAAGNFDCSLNNYPVNGGPFTQVSAGLAQLSTGELLVSDNGAFVVRRLELCADAAPTVTPSPSPRPTSTVCSIVNGPGWPLVGGDAGQTGQGAAFGPLVPTVRWSATGGMAPVVGQDGTVYVGRNTVRAYDPFGNLRWASVSFPTGSTSHSPLLMDGKIIVYATSGLFGLDPADGTETLLSSQVSNFGPTGVLGGNGVVVSAASGRITDSSGNVVLDPAYADSAEAVLSGSGWVYRLSQSDLRAYDMLGNVNFTVPTSNSSGSLCLVPGAVLVAENSANTTRIRSYSLAGGLNWTYTDTGTFLANWHIAADAVGNVFVIAAETVAPFGMALISLDASGSLRFKKTISNSGIQGTHPLWPRNRRMIIDAAGNIFVPMDTGVVAVDSAGDPLWSLPSIGTFGLALSHDGTLYAADASQVFAIGGDPCNSAVPSGGGSGGSLVAARAGSAKGAAPAAVDRVLTVPNPARDSMQAYFDLTEAGRVSIQVSDLSGRLVLAQDLGIRNAGSHNQALDIRGLASGLYFVVLLQDQGQGFAKIAQFKAAIVR